MGGSTRKLRSLCNIRLTKCGGAMKARRNRLGEAYNGIPTAHRVDRHRTCMRGASTSNKRHCGTAVYFLSLKRDKRITWNEGKRETYRPFCKYRYNCAEVPSRERKRPTGYLQLRGLM